MIKIIIAAGHISEIVLITRRKIKRLVFNLSLQMSGLPTLIVFYLQNETSNIVFCLCIFLIDLLIVILRG